MGVPPAKNVANVLLSKFTTSREFLCWSSASEHPASVPSGGQVCASAALTNSKEIWGGEEPDRTGWGRGGLDPPHTEPLSKPGSPTWDASVLDLLKCGCDLLRRPIAVGCSLPEGREQMLPWCRWSPGHCPAQDWAAQLYCSDVCFDFSPVSKYVIF